ncbi:oxidation resistance protein 1 [Pseudocyphellaria aurata]|nr:oxidation resistance protein 1 [Pseudocyphellaria aurata]
MSSSPNIRRSPSPQPTSTPPNPPSQPTSSYLSYPVSHVVSALYRRLTEPSPHSSPAQSTDLKQRSSPTPPRSMHHDDYSQPRRTASPFQPPPLTPLSLVGFDPATSPSAQILSRALAEEIRLLVPPRLQLVDTWSLVYSLEQDGVSLATLYKKCASPDLSKNSSFVLVIRDAAGGIFGAYLTDPPRPSPSFYGTGECFLWRAALIPSTSLLSISLPPPPSAPTTASLPRSTTIASPTSSSTSLRPSPNHSHSHSHSHTEHTQQQQHNGYTKSPNRNHSNHLSASSSSASTPAAATPLLRFKAFPYSGINDYLIFCEPAFLSVGGGDGRYGLWLDAVLERGVSSPCLTFGNEALSEEGEKFEVVGVEIWCLGG